MKIGVIGAPRTGKSVFARTLAAELGKRHLNFELLPEYASLYVQQVGTIKHAWEQLVIGMGQYVSEQATPSAHIITDAAAFAAYVYAQQAVPPKVTSSEWPRYRHVLDVLQGMARLSVTSYDLIFLLSHIFPLRRTTPSLPTFSTTACKAINQALEHYLTTERIEFHRLQANSRQAIPSAIKIIEQRLMIQ